jgi:hypothetical protein
MRAFIKNHYSLARVHRINTHLTEGLHNGEDFAVNTEPTFEYNVTCPVSIVFAQVLCVDCKSALEMEENWVLLALTDELAAGSLTVRNIMQIALAGLTDAQDVATISVHDDTRHQAAHGALVDCVIITIASIVLQKF